ncbi:restriction endonuclease subunit S [Rhodococcus globerulus]|uniref:restriction endonuclease subunit S n=1 Tax=Rhodococcus globerulus TaxID=33008 RepID=UPI001C568A2D|nr:restriction endonuclease subunit S [Rhodococcus globerulus]QXW00771.1 restriction endonuclease subunit S [Rhodococcus globerulus]
MRTTTLGELCREGGGGIQTGPFGSQLHAADYVLDGIPSVMPQNIGENTISTADIARITAVDAARLSKYLLAENDIVYSRRGDVEKRALVRAEQAGWLCGTGCLRVRFGPQAQCDPKFVSYYLGTESSRSWIRLHAVGATMPNLNTGILSNLPISLPTLTEQHAIATILGALDDKIAANLTLLETADSLACALFLQARLGSPESECTYEQIADVGGGGTPRTAVAQYWDGDVSWATPTDVTALNAPYLRSTSRMITDDGLANCSSRLYEAGSILMTSRATIGAFAIAESPMAVNQGFIVVNAKDPRHQWWLFHEMRSRVPDFISHANGATFLELPRGRFKSLPVPLPDDAVLAKFDAEAESLHSAASGADKESRKLKEIRDVLLPQLMSGKLRVRNAEKVVEAVL